MRSLALWKVAQASLSASEFSSAGQLARITATAVDLDQDSLLVATERKDALNDSEATVTIWNIGGDEGAPTLVTSFPTPTQLAANPWSKGTSKGTARTSNPEIVSLHVLPDSHSLVVITRAGDITTITLDDETPSAEVVGSVDGGVLGAAWSPDDTLLVLVTGEDKLILMTSTFDVLSEGPLHPKEFGEDAPINVGWGSKQTQFHGSLGKAAAKSSIPPTAIGASPDDDGHARISWRGDGAYFTVSVLEGATEIEARPRRTLRVYSREAALQSTAEPVPGLEHALSWRPSGNLIVGTQRFGNIPGESDIHSEAGSGLGPGRDGRHDVVFFERNGLRHGEFTLREQYPLQPGQAASEQRKWGYRVREVGWSSDSNVLSVWIEREDGDIVQLWTTGNYHWYLKQEIAAPSGPNGEPGRFTSVQWHPEDALRLVLTTASDVIQRTYAWDTFASPSQPPVDSGSVAVIDGTSVLLTPFRSQNVPPPMASHTLSLQLPSELQPSQVKRTPVPVHAAFGFSRELLAIIWEHGVMQVYDLKTRLGPGREKIMDPTLLWSGWLEGAGSSPTYRQVMFANDTSEDELQVAVLATEITSDASDIVSIRSLAGQGLSATAVGLPAHNGRLVLSRKLLWEAPSGDIYEVNAETKSASQVARFPEFCFWTAHGLVSGADSDEPSSLYIGLSHGSKLHITDGEAQRTLATNANSFTLTPTFLVYTTTAHVAHFAPLKSLAAVLKTPEVPLPEFETRRVERGSRIVTAVPSTMSLVLQMPRGNLETINPRPMVMEIVRQDIDSGNYGKAFTACRKHRIDLNVFVEHDQEAFIKGIPSFLDQVSDVDYINLFLTSLGQGHLPAELVARICDQIRDELEKRDLKKYVNSILTAHVVKRPPDHEAGLALLLRLKESEPHLVEDAVKYIIFLVDADKLFDTALGMYDFSLVLMVAQHAQKDPREYLPFLRELRSLDHYYQRFRIDDHLRRYEKALTNLSLAGSERFDEAMTYVEKHQLYEHALSIWRGTDKYEAVLNIYGDWLFERREFRDAAFVFRQANRPEKAMIAHEKALEWQELFELAVQQQLSADELKDTAYRVAEDLVSKKRTLEASAVLLDYAKDVREATIALVEGSHFSEARRIIVLHHRPELMAEIIHPGALECRSRIAEDLTEMREQLRKQVNRLRELRVRKVEEPEAFYGVEDTELHNVDVMTDISMAPTMFTRYTVAPSAVSKTSSKRSSRSKRKLERKVGSGRKGTVDEEEYLLKSVSKLVARFNATQADSASLLPHLLQFTDEHRAEAASLQQELHEFSAELHEAVDEIWKKAPESEEKAEPAPAMDSWAARMEAYEKQKHTNPLDKVPKPELGKPDWKLRLPDTRRT
ncbi:IkappaB kinase complex IKAP component [Trametes coccinea BRFM310]|uniref:Elongator complex protein 1 n=1 Tax=Trametes coccinea (strain BRFM310) TaxID=1353009 RepID=A0A1Y2IA44_TRAC3|nr:IkappaB kinase complex IKAP component [Trametes coccinea BRFM310]